MSEQQKNILREIGESVNALPDDLAQIAAAKISGFAEGVKAATLAQQTPQPLIE